MGHLIFSEWITRMRLITTTESARGTPVTWYWQVFVTEIHERRLKGYFIGSLSEAVDPASQFPAIGPTGAAPSSIIHRSCDSGVLTSPVAHGALGKKPNAHETPSVFHTPDRGRSLSSCPYYVTH
jgi:hypothetical protein